VLARCAAEGIRTVLICATGGERGALSDALCAGAQAARQLAVQRADELRQACAVLRISAVYQLGYRDSGMAGSAANDDPHAFCTADLEEVAERITHLIRRERPHVVVTYNERGGYGHPDHLAVHRATMAACAASDARSFTDAGGPPWQVQKLYHTVRSVSEVRQLQALLRREGLPAVRRPSFAEAVLVADEDVTTRIDVRPYLPQKRAALRAHRSQFHSGEALLLMSDDLAAAGFGSESFQRVLSHVPVPRHEDDLFAGLR
jgi:LmbE family N-acetylglucosaminyl deacetylase